MQDRKQQELYRQPLEGHMLDHKQQELHKPQP